MNSGLFHIYIRQQEGSSFGVDTHPTFESADTVEFDPETTLRDSIERLHDRKPGLRLGTIPEQSKVCADIGEALFKTFVGQSTTVLSEFNQYRHSSALMRLALHIPSSLYYLPWEILRDPSDPPGIFLALAGSIIRYDSDRPNTDFQLVKPPLQCLFMFSNPSKRPFAGDVEIRLPKRQNVIFHQIKPATFNKLRGALWPVYKAGTIRADNHVAFAFFGHGDSNDQNTGQLVFVKRGGMQGFLGSLDEDPHPSGDVQEVLAKSSALKIVFLCACESAWATSPKSFENSIAGYLLRGCPSVAFVIGAQVAIEAMAAAVFLHKMLSLLTEMPIDLAVAKARDEVRFMNSSERGQEYSCLDWWVPVLYARADSMDLVGRPNEAVLEPPDPGSGEASLGPGEPVRIPYDSRPIVGAIKRRFSSLVGADPDVSRTLLGD